MGDLINLAPLAIDQKGERFGVPAEARGWRVRRQQQASGRGTPMLVRQEGGQPLRLELDATYEDLVEAVEGVPGFYRLDPIDQYGNLIGGYCAVTEVTNGLKYGDSVNPLPVLLATIERVVQSTTDALKHVTTQHAQLVQQTAAMMEVNVKMLAAAGGMPRNGEDAVRTEPPTNKTNWSDVAQKGIEQFGPLITGAAAELLKVYLSTIAPVAPVAPAPPAAS